MRRYLAITAIALASIAQAYDSAWSHVATVTLDAAYIDEAPVVVPVYLSGFDSTWWANVQADGDDIRVTEDDDTTERDYYLVSINTGTPEGCIIVNVDGYASASVDKDLRVWVGNSGASAANTTSTFTASGYVGVYFPGESTNDATTGGRNLTAVNTPGTAAVAALEFDAATYNGSSQYHKNAGTQGVTNWPLTLELLASADSETVTSAAFGLYDDNSTSTVGMIAFRGGDAGDPIAGQFRGASGLISLVYGTTDYAANTLYYVVANRNAATGTSRKYINGTADGTESTTIVAPDFQTLSIGALFRSAPATDYFDGNVAYAAVSDEVRSADYIATMYDAWFTSAFRTYGATEANGGGATGHPWFYWRFRA